MGPDRDVVGTLERSIGKQGMGFMVALRHTYSWSLFPHCNREHDTGGPRYADPHALSHNLDTEPDPDSFDQEKPSRGFLETWLTETLEIH